MPGSLEHVIFYLTFFFLTKDPKTFSTTLSKTPADPWQTDCPPCAQTLTLSLCYTHQAPKRLPQVSSNQDQGWEVPEDCGGAIPGASCRDACCSYTEGLTSVRWEAWSHMPSCSADSSSSYPKAWMDLVPLISYRERLILTDNLSPEHRW